jgi:NADPH:quinone reductase-like Zn-dependent oxidoreductase
VTASPRYDHGVRAMLMERHGGPDVLQMGSIDLGPLRPGHVRVSVRAVALNHLDLWVREGWPTLKLPLPHILGADIAGVIAEVGSDVQPTEPYLAAGAEVLVNPGVSCGRCRQCLLGQDSICPHYGILGEHLRGGYAEQCDVPAQNILPKPSALGFEEAACLPLTFLTAWAMLMERAKLQPGETVLIQAAGSGVGVAALQIARLVGARVIATAGSDEKLARARQLGADETINYANEDVAKAVRRITAKQGVDVAFEHVGKSTWVGSLSSLRPGGRLVTCGSTTGYDVAIDLRHIFYKRLSILGSTMGSKGSLFDILGLVESGKLRPVLDRSLPLAEAPRAHTLLAERAQFGKIVLVP